LTGTSLWSAEDSPHGGRRDLLILIALLLFTLFFRLATLMMMNTGVDERDYWFSAKAIASGLPYPEITHRTTRFAIILPVALAQVLLGSHPDVYYLMPVMNALVQTVLAFAIGRKLRGRLTGFLAAMGLTLFPYMIRAGSQVRPEVFSITYILLSFYFFIEYLQRDTRELPPLLWTTAWLFIAYEAKITNLYFVPGMFLAIVLYKKKPAHAFLLGGILLFLFLAETGLYAAFTQYKLGELEIIAKNHFHSDSLVVPGLVDLFQRYASPNLQLYWQVPFGLFAIAAVVYLVRGTDRRISSLVLASLSFFLLLTFEVKTLHPVTPAESFINRYFSAVLPSVFLVLACAAEGIVATKRKVNGSAAAYVWVLTFCVLAVLGIFSLPRLPTGIRAYANSPLHPRQHPLVLNETYRKEINRAFVEGTPIVAVDDNGGYNAIQTCESYFIDPSFYRGGRPPQHSRVNIEGAGYVVLSHNESGIATDKVLAAIRTPFRVAYMPVKRIGLLTADSVEGKKGPADEDINQ
jgi:hypothetical protein